MLILLYAGVVPIGFSLLPQLSLGVEAEIPVGSMPLFTVYITSGIFELLLRSAIRASGIFLTGASGALFSVITSALLNLLYPQVKWLSHGCIDWITIAIVVLCYLPLARDRQLLPHLA